MKLGKLFSSNMLLSPRNQKLILVVFALIVSVSFILIGYQQYSPGFPLDDSWIHQTYARNLALSGRWEYVLNETSAGSTSPLWTFLLSIGYLLKIKEPYFWTCFLSISLFVFIVITAWEIVRKVKPNLMNFTLIAGAFIALDWHLLWSTASGMETILFCLLTLLIFQLLIDQNPKWFLTGLLVGTIVWVRPDGITLLGPVLLILLMQSINKQNKKLDWIALFLPIMILLGLYAWFNFKISGKIFPNTFYAKQIEYAILISEPIFIRVSRMFSVLISGAGIFLVPGFFWSIKNAILSKDKWKFGVILWILGYGMLYAFRLPVIYQHGRYLFPLIPVYMIFGGIGTYELITAIKKWKESKLNISTVMFFSIFICSFVFVFSGEAAFIQDLKIIDQLMVKPALWVRNNTTEDSLIAVHDIGAMGFYSERRIIDLAGLIQTDVIPIIRDEEKLEEYIKNKGADYLVIFKNWYPHMDEIGIVIKKFNYSSANIEEEIQIQKIN
jgi:hypothetical protein